MMISKAMTFYDNKRAVMGNLHDSFMISDLRFLHTYILEIEYAVSRFHIGGFRPLHQRQFHIIISECSCFADFLTSYRNPHAHAAAPSATNMSGRRSEDTTRTQQMSSCAAA